MEVVLCALRAEVTGGVGEPPETLLRGLAVINMLVKDPSRRDALLQHGAAASLVRHVLGSPHAAVLLPALTALCALLQHSPATPAPAALADDDLVPRLVALIEGSSRREVLYWALALLHTLSMREALRPRLIGTGTAVAVSRAAVANQGNVSIQKLCMHTLVLLVSNDHPHTTACLAATLPCGVVPCAVSALRAADPEVVFFSLGLLHGS